MSDPFVFLGVPTAGSIDEKSIDGLSAAARVTKWFRKANTCSLPTHGFNALWTACLNNRKIHGFTHFAMMHSDIQAEPGWLDDLMDEMNRVGADVISVVSPIKDGRGVTSCGCRRADGAVRRLTMRELEKLPETFTAADFAPPGEQLMANTGLWLARLDRPWVEEFPGFMTLSGVVKGTDGAFHAQCLPEDWNWSKFLAEKDVRVFVTRKIPVTHWGKHGYKSNEVWGWETDQGDNPVDPQTGDTAPESHAETIHGWTSREELRWLREQAKNARIIVEVGSWHGRSTYALAEACPPGGLVIAIDHFCGSPADEAPELSDAANSGPMARNAFRANLKPFLDSGKIKLLDAPSQATLAGLFEQGAVVDMVFIDGGHTYSDTLGDILQAEKILAPGGLICGHDIDREGVRSAVEQVFPGWRCGAGKIWYWRNVESNS